MDLLRKRGDKKRRTEWKEEERRTNEVKMNQSGWVKTEREEGDKSEKKGRNREEERESGR